MVKNNTQMGSTMMLNKYRLYFVVLITGCTLSLSGCASQNPDMQTMLSTLNASIPELWRLVTAAAYIMGFILAFKGLYYLKVYGEARTMMATQSSFKVPAIMFFV